MAIRRHRHGAWRKKLIQISSNLHGAVDLNA
jgi:hypothetical protein